MKQNRNRFKYIFIAIAFAAGIVFLWLNYYAGISLKEYFSVDKAPIIQPDYTNTVIPPNIAPLDFYVKEKGAQYYTKIYSKNGEVIHIHSRKPAVVIPQKKWEKLLAINKGNDLYFEIFIKDKFSWQKYNPIVNKIAEVPIDSHLIYRNVYPQFYTKFKMKLYQRNTGNFDAKLILDADEFDGCFNCHSFLNHKSDKFIIQLRPQDKNYFVLSENLRALLIRPNLAKPGSSYLSWHPSGNFVALTMNLGLRIFDLFAGNVPEQVMEHVDLNADLAVYDIRKNTLIACPDIALKDRLEIHPEWSPDGKYLYYLSAPKLPIERYTEIKYDLMRIAYDVEANVFGAPEVLISASKAGLGVTFPKVSPDGKFLLFCMVDHASLSIVRASSDLYLMDLRTLIYRKLDEVNSERADSYHSWGSNSRWFAFSTKRDDGIFTRVYFSYIDTDGRAYKPFIMPQKDPYFYDSFLEAYNIPELINEPLEINSFLFTLKIRNFDNIIDAYSQKDRGKNNE